MKEKWVVDYTTKANKDYKILKEQPLLLEKFKAYVKILRDNPFAQPYEKLKGLPNYYSRKLNGQHRLCYTVDVKKREVIVSSMWGHYND